MLWILILSQVVDLLALEQGLTVASAETSDGPKFVFPEEGDAYFGKNVDALKASLGHALDSDCLRSWPANKSAEIAVVFRHDGYVPETSQYYIQYQMEQVASLQTSEMGLGFRNLADNTEYKMKLDGAVQVWEWSPLQMTFVQEHLTGMTSQKIKHVPLWSSVDIDSGSSCHDILEEPTCESDPGADVLFFGHLTKNRQQLCADVDAEMKWMSSNDQLFTHECVSGVFGPALQCKICKAKVIYNDHSRSDSVLEVHRINPLLALGKAVISATSADTSLDTEYSGALELVPAEDIPRAVSRLLLDEEARQRLEWNAYAFAKKQKAQAQPALCRALNDLAGDIERKADLQSDKGLERRVRYLAVRRLGANGTNGTSGATSSSTSSAVTTTTSPVVSTSSAATTTSTDATSTTSALGVSTNSASTTKDGDDSSTSLAVTTSEADSSNESTQLTNGTNSTTTTVSITSAASSSTSSLAATKSTTSGPVPAVNSSTSTSQFQLDDPYGDSKADPWRAVSPLCLAIIIVALTRG